MTRFVRSLNGGLDVSLILDWMFSGSGFCSSRLYDQCVCVCCCCCCLGVSGCQSVYLSVCLFVCLFAGLLLLSGTDKDNHKSCLQNACIRFLCMFGSLCCEQVYNHTHTRARARTHTSAHVHKQRSIQKQRDIARVEVSRKTLQISETPPPPTHTDTHTNISKT